MGGGGSTSISVALPGRPEGRGLSLSSGEWTVGGGFSPVDEEGAAGAFVFPGLAKHGRPPREDFAEHLVTAEVTERAHSPGPRTGAWLPALPRAAFLLRAGSAGRHCGAPTAHTRCTHEQPGAFQIRPDPPLSAVSEHTQQGRGTRC